MAYADFTLEMVEAELGVSVRSGTVIPPASPSSVPTWLEDYINRGMAFALLNEKSRSEFIVAPILLAVCELVDVPLSIYSGMRVDIDAARNLTGECDFMLSKVAPIPLLRAPISAVIEATSLDVEASLGACIAQMVGAQCFNRRSGRVSPPIIGCVTDAGTWQFLRLDEKIVTLDSRRAYLSQLPLILGTFQQALSM